MNDPHQSARRIYEFFAEICKIPHPSYYCDGIRKYLKEIALVHNLHYREDTAGNVRLDRKNSDFPAAIALQSHMDMVPQSNDPDFDFTTMSIEIEETDGILHSKDRRTTLGADNGIGMATALTAMLDSDLKDYPLCAIFTVDEETGLTGAKDISPEFLECRALLNLDSEEWGEITIGCAGGARIKTKIPVRKSDIPSDYTAGVRIRCTGLKGGHSGTDINLNRGNAILLLLDFIVRSNAAVSEIKGGTISNAIPRSAEFTGAVKDLESLEKFAAEFKAEVKQKYDAPEEFDIAIEQLDFIPPQIIENFTAVAGLIQNAPNNVISVNEKLDCVETSNNTAIIHGDINNIELLMTLRSIHDSERIKWCGIIREYFSDANAESIIDDEYCAWESGNSPELVQTASDVFKELFNRQCIIKTIHAGLECGLFQAKNSTLPMISFGPTIRNPHSPSEELEIATLKDFYKFLTFLIKNILKK